LVQESVPRAAERVAAIAPLGFGHANVVVAVPQAWIDVRGMADLEDVAGSFRHRHGRRLRVATKYVTLTRAFFARHAISDYRIVESLGATEGAPASNAADLIVDITTTGGTLSANGLKTLEDGTILRSEAHLFASLAADWTKDTRLVAAALLGRIAAQAKAAATREVRCSLAQVGPELLAAAQARFAASAPFGPSSSGQPLVLHVPASSAFGLADWLVAQGARLVSLASCDFMFEAEDELACRLRRYLGPG